MIKLMLITNNPDIAQEAVQSGVDRIFVDLEIIGKYERQGHLNTLISHHEIDDISKIKHAIGRTELLVRTNPIHENIADEIERAIDQGADLLMLPMFHDIDELELYAEIIDQRAGIIPLIETIESYNALPSIVNVNGIEEIYIGLNDLHLQMQLPFMFDLLSNNMVADAAALIHAAKLPFGFGGVARVGEGAIPGEQIIAEHVRLGSSSVILSRTFLRDMSHSSPLPNKFNLATEIQKLRKAEQFAYALPHHTKQLGFQQLKENINAISKEINKKRTQQ